MCIKRIIKLYSRGESALTIEKITGINYRRVYRILDKNGIERRDHRQKTINAFKMGRGVHTYSRRKKASKRWIGKNNPRWQPIGTKRKSNGYIIIKTRYGWFFEHRLVVEKKLGRKLKKNECIHHINGKKDDNRPENFYLMTKIEHKAWHTLDNINSELKTKRPKLISNL